jgi:TIM-barrel protein
MSFTRNPSVLAAMAGITDGEFAKYFLEEGGAGYVTIGGYSIGKELAEASLESCRRGRSEFILQSNNESHEIFQEARKIKQFSRLFINLRINNHLNAKSFARNFADLSGNDLPTIEINAHCRQEEIMYHGGGQSLLRRMKELKKIIKAFQARDFNVSVKIRGNAISPQEIIPLINSWQVNYFHIDSYKAGKEETDLELLSLYSKTINTPIIGNNSIIDFNSARAVLNTGVSYYSIARATQKDRLVFKNILKKF